MMTQILYVYGIPLNVTTNNEIKPYLTKKYTQWVNTSIK